MAWYNDAKDFVGKAADYTPIVSNVKGAVQGDLGQAVGGNFTEMGRDAFNAGVDGAVAIDGLYNDVVGPALTIDTKPDMQREAFNEAGQASDQTKGYADSVRDQERGVQRVTTRPMVAPTINAGQNVDAQGRALALNESAAMGNQPSAAELMMRQQAGRDQAAQIGMASALNRGSVGGALYGAGQNAANISSQTNMNAGILRAQEMAHARDAFTQGTGAARGQDITLGVSQAGLQADANKTNVLTELDAMKANQRAGLDSRALDDQRYRDAVDAYLRAQGLRTQNAAGIDDALLDREKTNQKSLMGGIGSGISSIVGLLGSDEREKTNVRELDDGEIKETLNALGQHEFEYKDKTIPGFNAPGKRYGIMAQELERTKLGKALVSSDEQGRKRVDTVQATGLILAALGSVNRRLDKVEKR